MITLRWRQFPGSDVSGYKVYCSIIGFKVMQPLVTDLEGKTLILSMNGNDPQTITFDGVTPIADMINGSLLGGRAYTSVSSDEYLFVRSDVRSAPGSVEIVNGTSLPYFGLEPRTIYEKSEDFLLATIPAALNPESPVEFEDPDGSINDWYTVTSINGVGDESLKAPYKKPVSYSGELCVLEGVVTDLQGVRTPDAEVRATIMILPQERAVTTLINTAPITTLTGSDGRYSLPVLQAAFIRLEIPSVGYSRSFRVPMTPYAFVTDIPVDTAYQYPLEYNG